MDSVSNYINVWEGDFKEPCKFIDLVLGGNSIKYGILKIHRFDAGCNSLLEKYGTGSYFNQRLSVKGCII